MLYPRTYEDGSMNKDDQLIFMGMAREDEAMIDMINTIARLGGE